MQTYINSEHIPIQSHVRLYNVLGKRWVQIDILVTTYMARLAIGLILTVLALIVNRDFRQSENEKWWCYTTYIYPKHKKSTIECTSSPRAFYPQSFALTSARIDTTSTITEYNEDIHATLTFHFKIALIAIPSKILLKHMQEFRQ